MAAETQNRCLLKQPPTQLSTNSTQRDPSNLLPRHRHVLENSSDAGVPSGETPDLGSKTAPQVAHDLLLAKRG